MWSWILIAIVLTAIFSGMNFTKLKSIALPLIAKYMPIAKEKFVELKNKIHKNK